MSEPADDDARYMVIAGRRWRRSDPAIPETLRSELVSALMHARRQVKTHLRGNPDALAAARRGVHDAKVALGERGTPWWEPADAAARATRAHATARTLLRARAEDASVCPSEVARVLNGEDWRPLMSDVRALAAQWVADGVVEVTQKGEVVDPLTARGPIRLRRGPAFDDPPKADPAQ